MATVIKTGFYTAVFVGGVFGLLFADVPQVYASPVGSELSTSSVCAPAIIECCEIKTDQLQARNVNQVPEEITTDVMLHMDLASSSQIPEEFWNEWLSDAYKPIASELSKFDDAGINAAFVVAVMYTECGRTASTVGENNYFNFTVDTKKYTSFSTPQECMQYARDWMLKSYFNPEWHTTRPEGYCQWDFSEPLTIERINEHYAINSDGSVNWRWSAVVSEIMQSIYSSYLEEGK